jgi:hypothetical protein
MAQPASLPGVDSLLARLVGPLALATQDAVRRWGLAIDAGRDPGADDALADVQAETPLAGATLRGQSGASTFARSPAGSAQLAADPLRAGAVSGAATPVSSAVGLVVGAGPGLAAESTAAALPVVRIGSADFSAPFPLAAPGLGDGEAGETAGRRLHAPPTLDFPTPPSPALFGGESPRRRAGETNVAAAAATVQRVETDLAPAPLRAIGELPTSSAAARPPQPAPPAETAAAAVDFRSGTAPPPNAVGKPIAPASTSVVGVAAAQGRQHPTELGSIQAEARAAVPQPLDHVAAALRQPPLRSDAHRPAAAISTARSDRQPGAAAAFAANVDVVAPSAPDAVTAMHLTPGTAPAPTAASAAKRHPVALIRLRPAQQPAPIIDGSSPDPVESPTASPPDLAAVPGESGLGNTSAATASASSLTASPVFRAVAARLDQALAPVFARAFTASGIGFETGDQPLAADPSGVAPTQVSNTFNVKVALGGNASPGDVRQIEDAVADWLRDSARRQGLIG